MDILDKKEANELDDVIKKIMLKLTFDNNKIELRGSSSLKSQKYFSDYDLFSNISKKYKADEAYDIFNEIIQHIKDDNLNSIYFIELKLQTKKGKKIRWFSDDKFNKDKFIKNFDDVDFIKLDVILYYDYRFIELSVLYSFSNIRLTVDDYVKGLKTDISDLKKDEKYYKILKRMFNIYKSDNNTKKMKELSDIFNSGLGKLYSKLSNYEAIIKVNDAYPSIRTNNKIQINLKHLQDNSNRAEIEHNYKKGMKSLNSKAKIIYNNL